MNSDAVAGIGGLSITGHAVDKKEAPPSVEWEDVTETINGLCAAMPIGAIESTEGFTLFDSMSAIELMAPKMDSGMNRDSYKTVEQRLSSGSLPPAPRSEQELLAVLGRLFESFLSYCDGNSLPQSIFTCLYFHDAALGHLKGHFDNLASCGTSRSAEECEPDLIPSVLFVTSILVRKACARVRNLVMRADIYQEEDFAPGKFSLDLCDSVDDAMLPNFVQLVCRVLAKQGDGSTLSPATRQVVEAWFSLLLQFISAIDLMAKPKLEGFAEARVVLDKLSSELLPPVVAAFPKEDPVVEAAEGGDKNKEAGLVERQPGPADFAFDPFVNHHLLSPLPPREVPSMGLEKATRLFKSIVAHLRMICDIVECENLFQIYDFLLRLSSEAPNIIPRSQIITILYDEEQLVIGKFRYPDLIREHMAQSGVPLNILAQEESALFITRLVKPCYDILYLTCASRARMRRGLVHSLEEWSTLRGEAGYVDDSVFYTLHPDLAQTTPPPRIRYFAHWVKEWYLRLMITHCTLGFELELYATYEMDVVFWYLEYLLQSVLDHRVFLEQHIATLEELEQKQAKRASGSKKKKGGKKNQPSTRPPYARPLELDEEQILFALNQLIIKGNLRFMAALKRQDAVVSLEEKFTNAKILFARRFAPYAVFADPPLRSYEEFTQSFNFQQHTAEDLLFASNDCFQRAKKVILGLLKQSTKFQQPHKLQTLQSLVKVALTSSIAVVREQGKLKASSSDDALEKKKKLKLDASINWRCPVIAIP